MKHILEKLKQRQPLQPEELYNALLSIMDGEFNDFEIAAFLMGLGPENETVDHIVSAATALRERALHVKAPENTVDCCGTGGDGSKTLNISTAVAIVGAASGACVAKHGNRAASSQSGAADILEAMDIELISDTDKLEKALNEIGFAFLMAPHHHTSMARVAKIRKALGFKTLFNVLGPLSNPASVSTQLVGVYDRKWLMPLAKALAKLGAKKALIVHGEDGLDEITLSGFTYCVEWNGQDILEYDLAPDDFGLPPVSLDDIRGGSPQDNAKALMDLLEGEKNAYRDVVLANCAAVLKLSGVTHNLQDGVNLARESIDDGRAMNILKAYKNI